MKILYLITGLRLGGAEKQLLLLARSMQERQHEILVVAMEPNGILVDEFKEAGLMVTDLNLVGFKAVPNAFRLFRQIVKKFSPDLIHSHMIHANFFAALFKLTRPKLKLICTAHNIKEGGVVTMSAYHLIKKVADWSTNVSKEAYENYLNKNYFHRESSSCIPNAIDTAVFNPAIYPGEKAKVSQHLPQRNYVFLSAGRLHSQKNYPLLLKAFQKVILTEPNVMLLIAGEGVELSALIATVQDLGIAESVRFLGRQNNMPRLMASCDCFVLSSTFEGFGLVIAEAMAMELKVISTDCGGVREVMGGNGVLVGVADCTALSDAMINSISSNDKPRNAAARNYIKRNYSVSVVMEQWAALYNRIC